MTDTVAFRVADLPENTPTPFEIKPDSEALKALAGDLGLLGLRKLRFTGQIAAEGKRDWLLTGRLGATVIQPCVVTLEPVTTRIEAEVQRRYTPDLPEPEAPEVEMPDDDSVEPLGKTIDAEAVMAEALSLNLPLYPRKDGADLGEAVFAGPGMEPLKDEDAKPFAALAGLRDQLKKGQ